MFGRHCAQNIKQYNNKMDKLITVFISTPYTGNEDWNVDISIQASETLSYFGFVPFNPLLVHYWNKRFNHDYSFWVEYTSIWLLKCDVVFRLPGASSGVDAEVELAKSNGIPVFHSYDELIGWRDGK